MSGWHPRMFDLDSDWKFCEANVTKQGVQKKRKLFDSHFFGICELGLIINQPWGFVVNPVF